MQATPAIGHWLHPKDALNVYILDAQARRYSPRTLEHYQSRLAPFTAWLDQHGVSGLQAITPIHVRTYLVHESDRGLSPTTVHTVARALRAWLNFCVREGWIDASPMQTIAMPRKPKQVKSALSERQIKAMLASADTARDKAIILLLLDTGLRASELVALDFGDVDLGSGSVKVRQGKGAKDRTVYIGGKCTRALLRYLAERGKPSDKAPLFLSEKRKERLTRFGLRTMLVRVAERGKVEDCSPHALRRTFAINCIRSGMNIYVLARLMGHEDIDVLRQYLPLADMDLRQAHAAASPADSLR